MPKPPKTTPRRTDHPLADWIIDTESLPERGRDVQRTATAEEMLALAKELEIVAVERLVAKVQVFRIGDSHYRVSGTFGGDVVQSCVVTLEPLTNTVSGKFAAEFRPEDQIQEDDGVINLDDDTELEPLEGSSINFGRVVFEEFAASLDPYPRKPGAAFKPETDPASLKPASPFAVLAQLKNKEKK